MTEVELGKRLGGALWIALRLALVIYVLWLVGACFVQRRILFPSFAVRAPNAEAGVLPALERLWLETDEGRVEWWFYAHPDASAEDPAPLVLMAHGNGELIDFQRAEVQNYRDLGFHVVLCEYRGYGRSEGSPSQRAILEDHGRVLDLVLARAEVDATRLLFHGRSLGTGVVCGLLERFEPLGLVLTSPFTSVADIMRGFLVPRALVFDPFDNEAALRASTVPVLIIHGERDRTVPYSHGVALAELRDSIELMSLPDAGHNDLPMGSAEIWDRIEGLARAVGAKSSSG